MTNPSINGGEAPSRLRSLTEDLITHLDVRPVIAAGGEPFGQIMEAVAGTSSNGALRMVAPFKPAPLFRVLGEKGWSHWIERGEGAEWVIWFYRESTQP